MRKFFALPVVLFCLLSLVSFSCEKEVFITPEEGYQWPEGKRDYWPTYGWKTAPMEMHNIDPDKMKLAEDFARNDPLSRALLVVKEGYLVVENYYGDGGAEVSSNLWSVTKSYVSALVGLAWDQKTISSTDQLMSDLMTEYPEFGDISLHHVLTMTTGLNWSEVGAPWVKWVMSDDWVAEALDRGNFSDPGKEFFYSSANSQFLNALVYHRTGKFPGELAKEKLFGPMGVSFEVHDHPFAYTNWDQYREPLYQTWRRDPKGIETAGFGLYLTARDMAKFGYLYLNRGNWDGEQLLSKEWIQTSIDDHETNINNRYSYGYHWWLTMVGDHPAFLASGFGGQIIGVVPSIDLVVVLKYEAENPVHPESGTKHDDMHLFELVVNSVL